jgi:hypothetical protein
LSSDYSARLVFDDSLAKLDDLEGELLGADLKILMLYMVSILHFALYTHHSNGPRTSLCSRVSKTQLAWGSTRAACQFPFFGVVADK